MMSRGMLLLSIAWLSVDAQSSSAGCAGRASQASVGGEKPRTTQPATERHRADNDASPRRVLGERLWSDLHAAAALGDVEGARGLVSRGDDVDARATFGHTPLHIAALTAHKAMVTFLLQQGASVETRDDVGMRPLDIASARGDDTIVSELLRKGASISARGPRGWSALSYAVWWQRTSTVSLLRAKGAKLDIFTASGLGIDKYVLEVVKEEAGLARAIDGYGRTPLHWAARADCASVARILISNGADVNRTDQMGMSPLGTAIGKDYVHWDVVEVLLEVRPRIRIPKALGARLLVCSISYERSKLLKELLERHVDPNEPDCTGVTPLWTAITRCDIPVVSLLLRNGARADSRIGSCPVIHLAVVQPGLGMLSLLVERGADVNAADGNGITPLHLGVLKGRQDVVEFLLSHGAMVDRVDWRKRTPFALALEMGDVAIARVLREAEKMGAGRGEKGGRAKTSP